MAFDFGAALTSAGQIQPALQQARQQELEQRRAAVDFEQKQKTAQLNDRVKQQQIDKAEQDKQQYVPVRSYTSTDGSKHTVYLTPTGYQDLQDELARRTPESILKDAAAFYGGDANIPQSVKNQAFAMGEGMAYKSPPAERYVNGGAVPDPESPTGYSRIYTDPYTSQEISRIPTEPARGLVPTETDTNRTDPATGLTTHSSTMRRPLLPTVQAMGGSTAAQGSGIPTSAPPHVKSAFTALAAPPQSVPRGTSGLQLDEQGHIPPSKGVTEIVRATANAIIDSLDEKQVQATPNVKAAARALVQKYKGTSPSLGTGARQILEKMEPVYAQTSKLMKRIEDLGLKDNNTRGYLLPGRINYALGGAADPDTLSAEIANLSLGSVVEATAALSGSGSRALPALRIALTHTPDPWTDSPKLMYQKLTTINDRLKDVIEEARTGGIASIGSGPSKGGSASDIVYDAQGVGHRYKGAGPRNDPNSYVPVSKP